MAGNSRLDWVWRNRTRKGRAQLAGVSIARLAKRLGDTTIGASRAAALVVKDVVDSEFCRHCRIAVNGGRLLVSVDNEPLVYSMRLQWLSPLTEALAHAPSGGRITNILFAFGTTGLSLATLEQNKAD